MSLSKAQLISLDGGETIEFLFNPTQLIFTRKVNLTQNKGARTGRGLPKVDFAYPEACILNIRDVIFDTYEEAGNKSVMTYINKFEKAMSFLDKGDFQKKRPSTYVFTWGDNQYLKCFITDLIYTLTMFLPDGTPVRARVDLTLQEIDESTSKPGMSASGADRTDNRRI